MFEDSLVESRVAEISLSKRWTAVASISLQFAIAGLVIAIPLLHPEALPFHIDAPKLLLPLPPKPPAPPIRMQRVAENTSGFASPAPPRAAIISTLLPSRSRGGNGRGRGGHLPNGHDRKPSCSQRAGDAAERRHRCNTPREIQTLSVERRADRGTDHDHCELPNGQLGPE
jgi:hypothetical protein